jgi:hypothetical protein
MKRKYLLKDNFANESYDGHNGEAHEGPDKLPQAAATLFSPPDLKEDYVHQSTAR